MWEAATGPCVEEEDPWGIRRCRSGLLPFGLSTAWSSVVAEALRSSVSWPTGDHQYPGLEMIILALSPHLLLLLC